MAFQFENVYFLLILSAIPAIAILYQRYTVTNKKSILKFSSLESIQKTKQNSVAFRKHLPFVLLMIAFGLMVISFANPQLSSMTSGKGVNLAIVLDGSESMNAQDYTPNRLEVAKNSIKSLVSKLGGNNIGVILFESGANTISYLSSDNAKVAQSLDGITQGSGATAIGDGLALGVDMVSSIPDRKNLVILISDGVHNSGLLSPDEAIAFAQMKNVQVITIGMGSEEPVFLKNDIYGEPQYSELDEQTLQNIAQSTGGIYFKSIDNQTLDEIFAVILSNFEYDYEYESIALWFILASLVALGATFYIIYGKYRIAV